jgi:hypothetical protein
MRIREPKLFSCSLKSLEVASRDPNNRSQVALENEALHFDRFPAATWHTTGA